jgi:hypothetical protein
MTDNGADIQVDREDRSGEMTIGFWIRGDAVEPAAITSSLGIEPFAAFARGDPFTSGRRVAAHGHGLWKLESGSYVDSDLGTPHAEFLLNVLEPKKDFVTRYVRDPDYEVLIHVDWKSDIASGFTLASDILARLCALCNTFDVTFWPEGR